VMRRREGKSKKREGPSKERSTRGIIEDVSNNLKKSLRRVSSYLLTEGQPKSVWVEKKQEEKRRRAGLFPECFGTKSSLLVTMIILVKKLKQGIQLKELVIHYY